jgi:hypothetical protein
MADDSETAHTMEDVANASNDFYDETVAKGFDPTLEGKTLMNLLEGDTLPLVTAACEAISQPGRYCFLPTALPSLLTYFPSFLLSSTPFHVFLSSLPFLSVFLLFLPSALPSCIPSTFQGKLAAAISAYRSIPSHEPEHLGAKVKAVVVKMNAPHLQPSSIEERIKDGVNPACWGIFTLMSNME